MCVVGLNLKGLPCRFTTCSYFVVLLVFCAAFNLSTAQLNLFLSEEDARDYLKMDFQEKLYIIQAGVPATMVRNPTTLYQFMAPINPSISKLRISWYSSPQVSHYSLSLHSSDHSIMSDPVPSVRYQGIVQQSTEVFQVSFRCSAKKAGVVDMTIKLNYTTVQSGIVESEDQKMLLMVIRRECAATGGIDEDTAVNPSTWSRGLIVGLSAGLTLVLILSVGMLLLCRYMWRQRKLKMVYQEDLEMRRNSMLKSSKTSVDEDDELNEPFRVSKKGPFYSPPSVMPKGHVRDSKSSSNSSLAQLIIPEEDSDSDNLEKPEVKYVRQDICCGPSLRSNLRNKHGHRHSRHRKAGSKYSRVQEGPLLSASPSLGSEFLSQRRNSLDQVPKTEAFFAGLNEFWAAELRDILLPQDQLSVYREPLRRATFGYLYKGTVCGLFEDQPRKRLEVSIKALPPDETDPDTITSFMQEAMIIKDLKHPNIVKLVGVVLQRAAPPYIVTRLTKNGDLGHFLKISRGTSARTQTVRSRQLIHLGKDISSAMDYIAAKGIVLRNLAAKNCIVGDNLSIKIADFSLAKDVTSTNPNDKGIRSRLPVKWSAPESLKEEGQFSEKSDVWSFGVVLWELVTLAKAPYQAIDDMKMEQHLKAGQRLPQPTNCPYDLYLLMKNCWEFNPDQRPTFSLLGKQLEHFATRLTQNSIKFEYLPESTC